MMLRGNLKQVRIEKNPARLRALDAAPGETEPAAAMALALAAGEAAAGPPAPSAAAPEERPEEELGFTIDIKSFLKPGEKTYTQRCRLFVGNLPTDITEEDFKRLFERYGEPSEVFINRDRGFGFIRLVRPALPPPLPLPRPLLLPSRAASPQPGPNRLPSALSPRLSQPRWWPRRVVPTTRAFGAGFRKAVSEEAGPLRAAPNHRARLFETLPFDWLTAPPRARLPLPPQHAALGPLPVCLCSARLEPAPSGSHPRASRPRWKEAFRARRRVRLPEGRVRRGGPFARGAQSARSVLGHPLFGLAPGGGRASGRPTWSWRRSVAAAVGPCDASPGPGPLPQPDATPHPPAPRLSCPREMKSVGLGCAFFIRY